MKSRLILSPFQWL